MPKVVFRIRYYRPEDAELDATKKQNLRRIANRNYYSSNQSDGQDYLNYIEDGIKQSGEFDYLDYVGVHEKSIGAFDANGILDANGKKKLREELRKTKSVIWDCVISPEEELSKKRLQTYEDAKALIEKCLPRFLKENGIDYENIHWYGGLHKNTDNNHIHLSFYELEPRFSRKEKEGTFFHRGLITKRSINDMRVHIEEELGGNEFFFSQYQRKTLNGVDEMLKRQDADAWKEKRMKEKLAELYKRLPKGKANYMSLSMQELRPLIDEIGMLILGQNPDLENQYFSMKQELKRHDECLKEICESQNVDPERFMLSEKFTSDFKRRLGNKVIDYAKKYEWQVNYEGMCYESQRKQRNIAKRRRTLLLKSTANLTRLVDKEAVDVFEEFEARLRKAEHDRLVEEGEIELE